MSARSGDAELPELITVVGPTASGKTELAITLAELVNGEVISADSVQVYRHFDIGSGKPSLEEQRGVPHHLLDVVEPDEAFDASIFAARARECIAQVRARNRVPIVCGGTFLWIRALIHGLAPAPPKDDGVRQRHLEFVARHGRAALHAELAPVDAASYAKLKPNDFVRVSRALEVYELTGTALSEFQRAHGFAGANYHALMLGLGHSREQSNERIARRVDAMLARGWIEEVRLLLERGFTESRPMGSVGYAQVKAAILAGEDSDRGRLAAQITQVTRVFARRQRTWLRDRPVRWLDPAHLQPAALAQTLAELRAR